MSIHGYEVRVVGASEEAPLVFTDAEQAVLFANDLARERGVPVEVALLRGEQPLGAGEAIVVHTAKPG